MKLILVFLFFAIAVSACAPLLENPSTVTSVETPKPLLFSTPTFPALTPTITMTFRPGKSPSDFATLITHVTQIAQQYEKDCNGHLGRGFGAGDLPYSPDHVWRLSSCRDPKTGFLYTKVIQVNGSKSWVVPFYELFAAKIKDSSFLKGIKDSGQMVVAHWSGDGKYVYFYPFVCCIDGPVIFNGVPDLYQLALDTGKLMKVIPSGGRVGFSPDDHYLAYRTLPATLHLLNLQTNEDKAFILDSNYVNLGVFSWSPDSRKLVFVAALQDWDKNAFEPTPVSQNGFSLILLDLKTMMITTLIDNDMRMLVPDVGSYGGSEPWMDDDSLDLIPMNPFLAGDQFYEYQISKHLLTLASTPVPTVAP